MNPQDPQDSDLRMDSAQPLLASDIEDIERATVAAVSPEAVAELDSWLLPFGHGTVSRSYSAVPLQHRRPAQDAYALIDVIEARYRAQGLSAVFRLASAGCFDSMRQALQQRAYWTARPVLVMVADVQRLRAVTDVRGQVDVATAPDAAWAALFLGEGFDPVDGASRVKSLGRATGSLFASVRQDGRTLAAGAMAFSHGWCSVHGMRTAQGQRGRGLARQVLAALAQAALDQRATRVFLQVEEANAPALALYRRAGFSVAWQYDYWRPASARAN